MFDHCKVQTIECLYTTLQPEISPHSTKSPSNTKIKEEREISWAHVHHRLKEKGREVWHRARPETVDPVKNGAAAGESGAAAGGHKVVAGWRFSERGQDSDGRAGSGEERGRSSARDSLGATVVLDGEVQVPQRKRWQCSGEARRGGGALMEGAGGAPATVVMKALQSILLVGSALVSLLCLEPANR